VHDAFLFVIRIAVVIAFCVRAWRKRVRDFGDRREHYK
jgi:hypothetical protein